MGNKWRKNLRHTGWFAAAYGALHTTVHAQAVQTGAVMPSGIRVGTILLCVGLVCMAVGVIGIICLVAWQRASKKQNHFQSEREEVLDEIAQAELQNRLRREQERAMAAQTAQREPLQEAPIVPTTPAALQPEFLRPTPPAPPPRHMRPEATDQTVQTPQPVPPAVPVKKPEPAKASTTPVKKPEPAKAPTPPVKKVTYELEDILREVREGKQQEK